MKNKKIFLKLFLLVAVGVLISAKEVRAVNITASAPVRITPLCIEAGNFWAGAGKYPWDQTGDKIMIFEEQVDDGINATYRGARPSTPSVCNHTGRGTVWANVQEIMADSIAHNYAEAIDYSGDTGADAALAALASYKLITHALPDNWKESMAEWSQVPGQENIIYGVKESGETRTLEYVDVRECDGPGENCIGHAMTCNGESPSCTLNCTTVICGSNYNATPAAKLFTWTTDPIPKLVSSMPKDDHGSEYFWDGVWKIDVSNALINQTAVKAFQSNWPGPGESGWKEFRWFSHGHTALSPDMEVMAYYGNTSYMSCYGALGSPCYGADTNFELTGVHEPILNDCKLGSCGTYHRDTSNARLESSHVSWYGNNDYYFAYEAWGEVNAPHIENHDIWLVEYDRVNNVFTSSSAPLLTMRGSASWRMDPKCGWLSDFSVSYGNSPHGSDKRDGTQLYVFGNGGNYYTRTDEYCSGYAVPFGRNNGAWLVNLTTNGSSSDTTSPAPPSEVSVQ